MTVPMIKLEPEIEILETEHFEENPNGKSMKELFNENLKEIVDNSSDRSDYFTSDRYNQIITDVKEANFLKEKKQPLLPKHYRRLKRFDIITVGEHEKLISKQREPSTGNFRYFCKTDDLFDILEAAHIATGHKRLKVMEAEIGKRYCNVTRTAIQIYLSLCEQCQEKKTNRSKGLVVAPIICNYMNSRCQVDLIDMQSRLDEDYCFILNYQDHLTKFTILKPLKTKTAEEVANNLMDIFCIFGAPFILQSGNGQEFAEQIIQILADIWPGLKLVQGKPRDLQSQESVERSNQDVRDMLELWMSDSNTKQWSEGLKFIQSKRNRSLHEEIKKSPYEAMFGKEQKIGLTDSLLDKKIYESTKTEEDLERVLNGMNSKPETEQNLSCAESCAICEKYGVLVTCKKCKLKVHVKCGIETEDQVVCSHCNTTIKGQCEDVKSGLDKQAAKMFDLPSQQLPPAEVGQKVVVKVPDPDATKNVLATVISINKCDLYRLRTEDGELERFYIRNEVTSSDSDLIHMAEVPTTSLNLRQASALTSNSKQGFVMCYCKRYCISKNCNCLSKEVKCNSKCHNNSGCKNK